MEKKMNDEAMEQEIVEEVTEEKKSTDGRRSYRRYFRTFRR